MAVDKTPRGNTEATYDTNVPSFRSRANLVCDFPESTYYTPHLAPAHVMLEQYPVICQNEVMIINLDSVHQCDSAPKTSLSPASALCLREPTIFIQDLPDGAIDSPLVLGLLTRTTLCHIKSTRSTHMQKCRCESPSNFTFKPR